VFALLAAVSWNRWIEPYVDTGRELMVPWRLSHGEKLYRDIHFHHGPLGPYLAAGVDAVFGPSLPARTGLGALLALAHLAALGRLARRWMTPWRAALATSAAVAAAVFLRPGGWLFPFSLDTAIAVAALTWALVLVDPALPAPAGAWAGPCLAAALLSRPELGLAGIVVCALAARREPLRLVRLTLFPLAAGAAAYFALSFGTPPRTLIADGWLAVLDPPEAFRNVYRAYAGLDRVGLRSAELLLAFAVFALAAALLAVAAAASSRLRGRSRAAAAVAEGLAVAMLLAAAAVRFEPPAALAERLTLLPPLVRVVPPLLVLAAAARLLDRWRSKDPRGPLAAVGDAALLLAAVFSSRLLLAAGYVGPYDAFFLPLPIVVAVAGLFGLADRAASILGPALPRLTAAAIAVFALYRAGSMAELYRGRAWSSVDTPAGSLRLTEPIAATTRSALADLQSRLPAGTTLAGFPEAGFFNYTLGRRSPFWLDQFFPGHLDAAGEARAIGVLDSRPPDAILYANVLAVGEATPVFGRDYSAALDTAVRTRFRTASVHGPGASPGARIGDPGFFVEVLVPREGGP
jgi:hypothetical protein